MTGLSEKDDLSKIDCDIDWEIVDEKIHTEREKSIEYLKSRQTFCLENIIKFILFNSSPFSPHLWYLGAILYVIIIFRLVYNTKFKRVIFIIIPVLLLFDLILGKYSLLIFKREFPIIIIRNWLFVGIPYFGIGVIIKSKLNTINGIISYPICIFGMVFFSLFSLFERFLLVRYNLNANRDHYFSTAFLSIFVFLFFLFYVKSGNSFISRIGKNDSSGIYIYIYHYMFIIVARTLLSNTNVNIFVNPAVIFIMTTLFVELLQFIKRKLIITSGKESSEHNKYKKTR